MKKPEPEIVLPKQESFFSTNKLRRSARAGTHLPEARFNHLFPALELPALFPPVRLHPDDHVSFGSPELPPHQLYLGDSNLNVLRRLPSESIDLIYIDPPFFSNRHLYANLGRRQRGAELRRHLPATRGASRWTNYSSNRWSKLGLRKVRVRIFGTADTAPVSV